MAASSGRGESPVPAATIRRFDVFVEYNRIKNEAKGMSTGLAKGNALWLAKLMAARKFARTPEERAEATERLARGREQMATATQYPVLNGVPQTAELFDCEIIQRMGPAFYHEVLSPAIAHEIAEYRSFESIRDRLRALWNLRRMVA